MAIDLTKINGTDSLAGLRITINDNFHTIKSALNDVLSIIDIASGKIDNTNFGSVNNIKTENLTVQNALNVITGNIEIGSGNLIVGSSSGGYIQIGGGSNSVRMEKVIRSFFTGSGNIPTVNFSGNGATGGTGPIGYLSLPRLETSTVNDISNPAVGSLVYDINTNKVKVCTASGATGTWEDLN